MRMPRWRTAKRSVLKQSIGGSLCRMKSHRRRSIPPRVLRRVIGRGIGHHSLCKGLTMQKTILLTGAEDGFGLATALVLARAGHIVYADFRGAIAASGEISALARREDIDLRPVVIDAVSQCAMEAAVGSVLDETGR